MSDKKNASELPLYIMLPVGLITLNAAVGIGVLLSMYIHWGLGLAAIIFLFIAMAVGTAWTGNYMLCAAFAALIAGLVGVIFMAEARFVEKGQVLIGILPHEAAGHPDAACFYFKDTRTRLDLMGSVTHTHKENTSIYYVAPVVGSQWTPGQKVVVWAIVSSFTCLSAYLNQTI